MPAEPCPFVAAVLNPTAANLLALSSWLTRRAEALGWPKVRTQHDCISGEDAWRFLPGWHATLGRTERLVDLAWAIG